MEAMLDLAEALAPHLERDPRPVAAQGDRLAAVLAVVVGDDEPALLLTERAASMSRHAGEVSFPGGLAEPEDPDLRATAVRETHEELGIDPEAGGGAWRTGADPHLRLRNARHARSSP